MPKVLNFLEKYVQWIALGLGVLYLGWMAYSYFVVPPLVQKVGNGPEQLPGDVDPYVVKTTLAELQSKIKDPKPLGGKPTDPVGQLVSAVEGQAPVKVGEKGGTVIVSNDGPKTKQAVVTSIAPPPAVTPGEVVSGRTMVTWKDPGAGATAVPVKASDADWASIAFHLDMAPLAAELVKKFEEVGFATDLRRTAFLRVWLEREEKLANGQFGNLKKIQPLLNVALPSYPSAATNKTDKFGYRVEAAKQAAQILTPPFVDTVPGKGDQWRAPGGSGGAAAPPAAAGRGLAGAIPAPTGTDADGFDPAAWSAASFNIIAHDISLEPGKTYRYRLSYAIWNPFFDSPQAAPDLAKQFDLVSPPSAWSDPVEMKGRAKFWLADFKSVRNQTEAQVDLFTWKDGGWKKDRVSVAPGDPIGDTQWSVVDVRGIRDKTFAVLADPAGKPVRRTKAGDALDPEYNDLKNQTVAPGEAPATPPEGVPVPGAAAVPAAPAAPTPLAPGV